MIIDWHIKTLEQSKKHIKFHLYAGDQQVSGPCGLTMDLSTFEDFAQNLGIDSDIVFNVK